MLESVRKCSGNTGRIINTARVIVDVFKEGVLGLKYVRIHRVGKAQVERHSGRGNSMFQATEVCKSLQEMQSNGYCVSVAPPYVHTHTHLYRSVYINRNSNARLFPPVRVKLAYDLNIHKSLYQEKTDNIWRCILIGEKKFQESKLLKTLQIKILIL